MSSDSTVASKQARLLAQKQRRLECHRQGVAVSLLLETGFARALCSMRARTPSAAGQACLVP